MEYITPSGRYKMSTAARLMEISRSSLYNYIHMNIVKSGFEKHQGKIKQYISGLEIIKFKKNRFYEA